MNSNLMMFEGKQVEVFEFNGTVLFNPKHVGECLEIKDTNSSIRDFNNKQVVKLTNSKMHNMQFRKLHNTGENFLTESGVYKLIFKSKKKEAEKFQDWVTDEVLPQIRQTGGYIPIDEEENEQDILAKALLIAQNTLKRKDELLKVKDREIESKNRFLNQLSASKNSLLVREVAKIASKENILIGEKKLWSRLREWGLVFKNTTEPKQSSIEKGLFEVVEGTRESSKGIFTYHTTRVTGKGQAYIINRLLEEEGLNKKC